MLDTTPISVDQTFSNIDSTCGGEFINKSEPSQIGDFQPAGRTQAKKGFTIFVIRFLRFLSFSGNDGGGLLNFNLDKL